MVNRDSNEYYEVMPNATSISKQECSPMTKKAALKNYQKKLLAQYKKVKQMTIDYYCREDLTVTTLKEFFEIFISSLKKDQAFHQELISS